MNIGNTIRSLRKKRGITQKELSKLCGISQTYISQIENDARNPTLNTLDIIGKSLKVPHEIIAFLSLDSESVAPNKREIFNKVFPSIKAMVVEYFITD